MREVIPPPRLRPSLRAAGIEAMAWFTPRNWCCGSMIVASPALCSKNRVKSSAKSGRRVLFHVP